MTHVPEGRKIVLAKWAPARVGEDCPECGAPITSVNRMVTPSGEVVGPRNVECKAGHEWLDSNEPIANCVIPIIIQNELPSSMREALSDG